MASRGAKGGKKAAKTYERPGLSDEEIEEIKEAFNLFDTDGSGACMAFIEEQIDALFDCDHVRGESNLYFFLLSNISIYTLELNSDILLRSLSLQ